MVSLVGTQFCGIRANPIDSTSPSICVGFSDIFAGDNCGGLSTDGEMISYTIVPFTPGELSTIEMPAWIRDTIPAGAIKSFDTGDLPCPPLDVMVSAPSQLLMPI